MAFEWFIEFVIGVFTDLMLAILPDFQVGLPELGGALSSILVMNAFFPLTETLAAALVLVTLQSAIFMLKLTQTILSHVPWVGGGGA